MGFRFQKRIKVLPGITLNLSKKGVSTSVGVKGARATVGHGQTRITAGLPGTGLSHTQVTPNRPIQAQGGEDAEKNDDTKNLIIGIGFIAALFAVAGLISKCSG